MGIFTPFAALYYSIVLKVKFSWFSRVKNKKIKAAKAVLYKKLEKSLLDESCVDKIIENYLNFGETIFDRKLLQSMFSMNRALFFGEQKIRDKKKK